MWETWVRSLGWEDPLEKGMAAHSCILAWRIPWTIAHGVRKSWTRLSDFHFHYYLFLLGWVLVTAHWIFTFNMWDLVPWPGIKPRLHALGEQSLRQWTIREVLHIFLRWCFCRWLRSPGVHWFFLKFQFQNGMFSYLRAYAGVQWTDSCWHNAIRGSLHQNLNQATIS